MRYPDDVLVHLSRNFSDAHWLILELLSCKSGKDPESVEDLLPFDDTPALLLSEICKNTTLTTNYFRLHIALLEGAGAIELVFDKNDSRKRPAIITENGYRLVTMRLSGQIA